MDPDEASEELQCSNKCHSRQQYLSVVNFYQQLDKKFSEMQTFTKKMLGLFSSTYLHEQAFLVINNLKEEPLEIKTERFLTA